MSAISDRENAPRLRIGSRVSTAGRLQHIRRRWNEAKPLAAPPREAWPLALRRARVIGLALLVVQFAGLCWWGGLLAHRYALSWDFAVYTQPMYLIAHGDLNPYSTLLLHSFWKNSVELIIWPLSLIRAVAPNPATLKVLQTIAMVGAEAVALGWICDIAAVQAKRIRATTGPVALVALGVLLLVTNPWYTWTLSFDFHPAPFLMLFLLAGARDVFRGRRSAWIWLVLALICSALGATYVVALGAAAALSGRYWLRQGAGILLLGLAWLGVVAAIGGNDSAGVYVYLITGGGGRHFSHTTVDVVEALVKHPGRALSLVWGNRFNVWAEISAAGLIGFFWPPAFVMSAVILAEADLIPIKNDFSAPGLQNNIPAGPFVTVGTIVVCAFLLRSARHRRLAVPALLAALAINAVAWAAVWFPQVPKRWLLVSAPAASALREVNAKLKPDDEVIVSQGVIGAFADRRWIYELNFRDEGFPVTARRVWVIVTPRQGDELLSVAAADADIGELSRLPGARLVSSKNGVWAFEWTPPPGTKSLALDGAPTSIPPWSTAGAAGTAVLTGERSQWHVASTSRPGYTLSSAYWRELPGRYEATVSLSVARRANVEVWDDSKSALVARKALSDTHGRTTVRIPVDLRTAPGDTAFDGWGIWRMTAQPPPPGDNLEIRVWSPGGKGQVKVYGTGLTRVPDEH